MDGGGRLLRSVKVLESGLAPSALAFAGSFPVLALAPRRAAIMPPPRRKRHGFGQKIFELLAGPGIGASFSLAIVVAAIAYGVVRGGHYDAFVAENGEPRDVLAQALGFAISSVSVSGNHELTERQILSFAGISSRDSLPWIDAERIRERLQKLPRIKAAAVTKLYPGRLLIEVEERQPYALWQRDGEVQIVAADGLPIAPMRDRRFIHLPLVVGDGANEKLADYMGLLEASGSLRDRIIAGVLVTKRRWTLKTDSGIEILLPETNPQAALAQLATLQETSNILDKDLVFIDLRQPDRLVVRLTEEAASERAAVSPPPKAKAKGGHR